MKRKKIFLAMLLAVTTTISMGGCTNKQNETATSESGNELSYWCMLSANASQAVSNMSETSFAKQLMADTGVKINYLHPPQGQQGEKFNLMIASNELPDIIEYNWYYYTGGPEKALEEGLIVPIDIEKDAPNLYAYLKDHPEIDKMCKTDDGKYFGFPFIRGDRWLQTSAGIIIRQDWLDDLGLSMPETIDDWTNVLTQFKEKKGAKAPLSVTTGAFGNTYSAFVGAYGITTGLYLDNDQVKMGELQPEYKEFLKQMNEWYKAGLLDNDFISLDNAMIQTNILNGVAGGTVGSVGGNLGKWMAAKPNDKYSLVGAPNPVLKKGDSIEFGNMQLAATGTAGTITKNCKNYDAAVKLLDYGYSEKGHMLFNFGIEGESYEMKDGYPTYTENITNSSDGTSMAVKLSTYALSQQEGVFVQDKRYMEQYAQLPQQKEAISTWSNTNMEKHLLPNIVLTSQQVEQMKTKLENMNTYNSEMMTGFITGAKSLDQFDSFVAEMKTRGAEEYVNMMQEAYDRYLQR